MIPGCVRKNQLRVWAIALVFYTSRAVAYNEFLSRHDGLRVRFAGLQ